MIIRTYTQSKIKSTLHKLFLSLFGLLLKQIQKFFLEDESPILIQSLKLAIENLRNFVENCRGNWKYSRQIC